MGWSGRIDTEDGCVGVGVLTEWMGGLGWAYRHGGWVCGSGCTDRVDGWVGVGVSTRRMGVWEWVY